ncbi:MAG: ABC transporter ATP-binding protein [Treponema sp.]|nr:ABC transporter ATP-binding protein [Treponema sp.]
MARLLEIKNLTACINKNGRTLKILDNINLSIDEGEILGLAGESGCGKSMTALCIAGLLPDDVKITEGHVIYKKHDLVNINEKEFRAVREEIGLIFQDSRQALNPLIKAGRQITEVLELGRNKRKENREQKQDKRKQRENDKIMVLELLTALGFNDPEQIFNAYPHQLSGGMCQRIMTAIAVINNPKLLLGDEPSSSLDEESQEKCLAIIKEINNKYKTSLLIISHDLSIIKEFCSRFIIMYAGRIVEEGCSSSLYSPLHPYTCTLVNARPSREKRGKKLESIRGKVPSVYDQLTGCPFAPRCLKAKDICREIFPPLNAIGNGKVYCYYPNDSERCI